MREKANCLNSNARFMRRALCFKGNMKLPFGAGQRQHARSESRRSTYVQRAGLATRQLYSAAHVPASQPKRTLPPRPRPRSGGVRKGAQHNRTACLARLTVGGTWGSMRQAEINAAACTSNSASGAPPSPPLTKKTPHI